MSEPTTTPELHAIDFAEFFTALWHKPPFAWQKALAKRVLESSETPSGESQVSGSPPDSPVSTSAWPEAIALPTASGKTACMDIAVFALAAQASRLARNQTITAPRRIFFVVDRRVIVDEAYERARRLAEKLDSAEEGILKVVADSLRQIAHGATAGFDEERPLAVHALRGGMYRSEAWARNPLQPSVVASTVDQTGSRLLFRAYGRGPGVWPIYAGLVANDSLILLDEAHCARPFLQTLQAVRRFRTWAHAPLGRSFWPVVMSATPPPGIKDVFEDLSAERLDPVHPLGRRQLARKPARLHTVTKATGRRAASVFAEALARAASELINEERRAIVVFVNRVAAAREAHRRLAADHGDRAVLLTGRMRPVDKDAVVQQRLRPLQSDRSDERILAEPLIVVATQTLEVGADLDFDSLVTECASLDALRQRFGRLNRMGRPIEARAEILLRGDQAGAASDNQEGEKQTKGRDDPVYGSALAETWAWLDGSRNEDGEVDFGIACLDPRLPEGDSLAALNAPAPDAPVMLPSHIDCWAQTAPLPRPSPDVAAFLHGPREGAADVRICWRGDLNLTNEEARAYALESLTLCPPSGSETLPVPIGVFKRWLAGEDTDDESADVEGVPAEGDTAEEHSGTNSEGMSLAGRRVVRWRGAETRDAEDITSDPAKVRPGDVVVVPADHPCPWYRLGDLPPGVTEPAAALDVGDHAYLLARAKPILRLHPALVEAWPDAVTGKAAAVELLSDLERKYEDAPDEIAGALHELLKKLSALPASLPQRWHWLAKAARALSAELSIPGLRRECRLVGKDSLFPVGRRHLPEFAREADSFSDEDDASASGYSHRDGRAVPLRQHLPGVEAFGRRHALGCGLPCDLVGAVARAGLLHDLGKADPRFQSWLRGGPRWLSGELLAKSGDLPKTRAARVHARSVSGYPVGGRHELLSVRLAESAPASLPDREDLRELTLHLIASHHGHCRPFAPVVLDHQCVPVSIEWCGHRMQWSGPTVLERLDSGVADRYWRLIRRYGWWGLAWLEALLRLADWRRSEWEETHDAEP